MYIAQLRGCCYWSWGGEIVSGIVLECLLRTILSELCLVPLDVHLIYGFSHSLNTVSGISICLKKPRLS